MHRDAAGHQNGKRLPSGREHRGGIPSRQKRYEWMRCGRQDSCVLPATTWGCLGYMVARKFSRPTSLLVVDYSPQPSKPGDFVVAGTPGPLRAFQLPIETAALLLPVIEELLRHGSAPCVQAMQLRHHVMAWNL